jgi:excisionase family DNA binding protein
LRPEEVGMEELKSPKLLNVREAAEALACSPSHIYEMAALGKIPSYRFGRSLRFDLDELLAATRAVSA